MNEKQLILRNAKKVNQKCRAILNALKNQEDITFIKQKQKEYNESVKQTLLALEE